MFDIEIRIIVVVVVNIHFPDHLIASFRIIVVVVVVNIHFPDHLIASFRLSFVRRNVRSTTPWLMSITSANLSEPKNSSISLISRPRVCINWDILRSIAVYFPTVVNRGGSGYMG